MIAGNRRASDYLTRPLDIRHLLRIVEETMEILDMEEVQIPVQNILKLSPGCYRQGQAALQDW